jgi:hypothetical protein
LATLEARATSRELHPNGSDDTAQLQEALRECASSYEPCDLRLGEGVFNTDVLLVEGFNGSITGRGQERTIIRALPKLRSGPRPFDDEPSLENPYPVLLHFYGNSKVSISKLTIEVPAGIAVDEYRQIGLPPQAPPITTTLISALVVAGDRNAELEISRVTILGAGVESGPPFSTLISGVLYEGEVRGFGADDRTMKLQDGRLKAHQNEIRGTELGFWLADADNIDAVIAGNELHVRGLGIYSRDLGGSRVVLLSDDISAESEGIFASQESRPPMNPSDYTIALNRIRVNEEGTAPGPSFDGVSVADVSGEPEALILNADFFFNDIVLGPNVFAGIGVFSDGPGDIRVIGNRYAVSRRSWLE